MIWYCELDCAADARAKRAGLDYWPKVHKTAHSDESAYLLATRDTIDATIIFSKAERYGSQSLHDFKIGSILPEAGSDLHSKPLHVALAFGSETAGVTFLEESSAGRGILKSSLMVYLPMHPSIRSQNLANTASMALYEMSRQAGNLPLLEAATAKRA